MRSTIKGIIVGVAVVFAAVGTAGAELKQLKTIKESASEARGHETRRQKEVVIQVNAQGKVIGHPKQTANSSSQTNRIRIAEVGALPNPMPRVALDAQGTRGALPDPMPSPALDAQGTRGALPDPIPSPARNVRTPSSHQTNIAMSTDPSARQWGGTRSLPGDPKANISSTANSGRGWIIGQVQGAQIKNLSQGNVRPAPLGRR